MTDYLTDVIRKAEDVAEAITVNHASPQRTKRRATLLRGAIVIAILEARREEQFLADGTLDFRGQQLENTLVQLRAERIQ